MADLTFLKNKADLLFKDYKTLTVTKDSDSNELFEYHPKTFDIKSLFDLFGYDQDKQKRFKHSNALHMIAQMVGAYKWNDLLNADSTFLNAANLLISNFKNADDVKKWSFYTERCWPLVPAQYYIEAQSFYDDSKNNTYYYLLNDRINFIYDYDDERPSYHVTKNSDNTYTCEMFFNGSNFNRKKYTSTTEEGAKEACSKDVFSFFETLFIQEQDNFFNTADYEPLIRCLEHNNFIRYVKDRLEQREYEEGVYYFYSFTCKRIMKTIHHEGCYYTEEDAKQAIWKEVIEDVVFNEDTSR